MAALPVSTRPPIRMERLADIALAMRAGGTPRRANARYWNGDIPFVKIEDITSCEGLHLSGTKGSISQEGLDASSAWLVPPGHVLVSMYASIGAVAINDLPVATNQAIMAIAPDPARVDPEFLAFSLRYLAPQLEARNIQTTQRNINAGILRDFTVPLPPLEEQQRTARILSTIQAWQRQVEAESSRVRNLHTAALAELIDPRWPVVPMGEFAKIGNGSTPKRDDPRYWSGGTIPWLTSAKIHEGIIAGANQFVTDVALRECHLPRVPADSVLVAITGQGKTLGNAALLTFESCVSQHLAYIRIASPRVSAAFLWRVLSTKYEELRSVAMGGGRTKGALTCGFLSSYKVPVPPLGAQERVTMVLDAIDGSRRQRERQLAVGKALFQSALSHLMERSG